MRADNSHHVIAAARQRSKATKRRAIAALRVLDNTGTQVSFDAVAREAKVSRSWLYAQPDLRAEILRQSNGRYRLMKDAVTTVEQIAGKMGLAAIAHEQVRGLKLCEDLQKKLEMTK